MDTNKENDMNYTLFHRNICLTKRLSTPIVFLVIMFTVLSCDGRADLNNPIGDSKAVPQAVTVTKIENISGAAIIEYQVPQDENINYVEAVVEINGRVTKTKGSFYTRTLTLEGFTEAKDYAVSLYSVSFSEIRSEPVNITVSPTHPPYLAVAEDLEISPIFGGVKAIYQNPTKSYLQIAFLGKDNTDKWVEYQTLYTNLESGTFYVRGLEAVEQTFGIVCRDRWQNISDTLLITTTPLFEALADLSLIKSHPLPSDITYEYPLAGVNVYHSGAPGAGNVETMWDGYTTAPFPSSGAYFFFQNPVTGLQYSGLPSSISIDLGKAYHLSRIVWWQRQSRATIAYDQLYNFTHPKIFELWGSNNPSPDGSYETWNKIDTYESVRPSGNTTPGNAYSTEEDRQTTHRGESFDIPEDTPAYRYIRYKVFSTWGNQNYWSCSELQFYGSAAGKGGNN
ncbi:DUF5000 domain-containing lipoprotein [uncultured Proteiniphilum sp.]|uniref:DUF5000 domain-containing lipoprotein n=1 Tax=uncultured Proteiniphilum sp. TaxID=497637 RepID=UPI002611A656|nr:DUF5000 domain-containing lipoprotein [uncultured Proteiniphilum sp.]